MTARFADALDPLANTDPSAYNNFFDAGERGEIIANYVVPRELPCHTHPPTCDINLFFGFFFDGTNNNLKRDRRGHTHSNVARLYGAFPGGKDRNESDAWPGANDKYRNFFRTYVPGAGTQFDEVPLEKKNEHVPACTSLKEHI